MFNDEGLGAAMGQYAAEKKTADLEKRIEEVARRLSLLAYAVSQGLPPDLLKHLRAEWPAK